MIDTDKYEGHSTGWKHKINHSTYSIINDDGQKVASVPCYEECNKDSQLIADAPLLLAEVKQLREENDLLRSMQRDGIEASTHDNFLSEINRLREDNEKLHDAINRSFHAKISGSALEIYNGWWEGEEE